MGANIFAADEIDAVFHNLSVIGEAATPLPENFIAGHHHAFWAEMRGTSDAGRLHGESWRSGGDDVSTIAADHQRR